MQPGGGISTCCTRPSNGTEPCFRHPPQPPPHQPPAAAQEKRDGGLELLAERAEENANAEAQVRRLEAQFRAGREAVEAEVASAAAAVEALAEEVAGLRNANGATVAEGEERLRALQAEHEELQRCVFGCGWGGVGAWDGGLAG